VDARVANSGFELHTSGTQNLDPLTGCGLGPGIEEGALACPGFSDKNQRSANRRAIADEFGNDPNFLISANQG
jgi:hypothetical protein